MSDLVQGVTSRHGRDLSNTINAASQKHGIPPQLLLACAISESNLDELAWRDMGGADRSAGLFQQTIRYAPIGDRSDSAENTAYVRHELTTNLGLAADIAARQLGAYWAASQDWRTCLAKYNGGPGATWASIPAANRANYERGYAEAAAYMVEETPEMDSTGIEFGGGFADLAAQMTDQGQDPGQPLTTEYTDGGGVTRQVTTAGEFLYVDGGQPSFLAFAAVLVR